MSVKIHRGKIVAKAVKESGITITALAKRLSVTRPTVYNMFNNPTVDWDTMDEISRIINYDFNLEIKGSPQRTKGGERSLEDEVSYWKNKYIGLLEEYNALITGQLASKNQ
jgi:hypothetical protein